MKPEQAPLVSVIVCFLNEETFLAETVESVLRQEFTDWELLLVDDGSTDKSSTLARAYVEQHPDKIYYVEHPDHANKGLSASRNAGIRQARGELLALLDADDVWFPNKLTQQVAIMEQHPDVTLLMEASEYWYNWNNPEKSNVFELIGTEQDRVFNPPQLMLDLYPLGQGAAPVPSGLMIRKSLLNNQYFEESFRGIYAMYEDQAFLAKMYLNEKVYVSSACTNLYRQRIGSLVQSVEESGQYREVRSYFLTWLENYLSTQPIVDKRVKDSLQKAQAAYRANLFQRIMKKLSFE
ncbi:glycosyltransferase family A protein [Spirosoma sp. KNUC1025]|uniref:glycosyltransferase family 2 protein n=1 Tax=Spirosoma sp. KNUC1025 TaxID=2894082 RepID=UPI00386E6B42|nr:glycosyltransferase [Spirosoma sp. KNUC1025]